MVKIIILREKHGDTYLGPYSTDDQIEEGAASVIRYRVKEGYWYDPSDTMKALAAIENKDARTWLRKRDRHEYEGFEIRTLEPSLS